MPKTRNSYNKGLNQDSSRSKYDPTSYYNALNLRVVTHEGLSTGSLENENGNILTFTIPNLLAENNVLYKDGTTDSLPAQNNLRIIGWTTVSRYIILFTTSETIQSPTTSLGQIWKIEYNESTNTISGLIGNSLDPAVHLKYNNRLALSSYHRIEAVGRYENESTIGIYWTDFYNNIRTFNVADNSLRVVAGTLPTGVVTTIKPSDVDIKPNINFSQPKVIKIGSGSLPAGGKVQYAYRLISKEGAQTVSSPTSSLVSLTDVNPNSGDYKDYKGAPITTSTPRSVTFSVKGLDTNYNIIEHIAILYEVNGSPSIFKFGEDVIPASGDIEVTLSGAENRIPITATEFSILNIGFDVCKSIDVKDNRLVAGNIKTTIAEISDSDFDARVYRFNSSRVASIEDTDTINNITINGITKNIASGPVALIGTPWTNVPADHDAINPFNNDLPTNTNWFTNDQYKFQSNGTTIGGEGPYIKYEFVTHAMTTDTYDAATSLFRKAPFINVSRTGSLTLNLNETLGDGSLNPVDASGQFNNFASPIVEAHVTGHARDEVYRYGIEFYKKKGTATFVKWIGDIKFPTPADGFPIGTGSINTGDMGLSSLGIKFTVDISNIANDIAGYRIVRAERKEADRTRLGTGTILIADLRADDDDVGAGNSLKNTLYEVLADPVSGVQVEVGMAELEIDGDNAASAGKNTFHLPDQPGFNEVAHGGYQGPQLDFPSTKSATILISPLNYFRANNGYQFRQGDFIKTFGYYQAKAFQYVNQNAPNDEGENQGWVYFCRTFENVVGGSHSIPAIGYESFSIQKADYLVDGEVIKDNTSKLPNALIGQNFANCSYGKTSGSLDIGHPFGIGNDTYLVTLDTTPSGGHMSASDMGWNSNIQTGTNELSQAFPLYYGAIVQTFRFKEICYSRPLDKQYGGNSFEDRSKQVYISTNHFQPVTDNTPTTVTFNVFGGDVYVNYFDKEYIHQYWNDAEQNSLNSLKLGAAEDRKMSVALFMPTESTVNTSLSNGRRFNSDRNGDNMGAYVKDSYIVNPVYAQQNNVENKFFAKDFALNTVEAFPHRLWASAKKIDGENLNSWRNFKDNNFIDVEGIYGPINKVVNFQDKLIFYQTRAFGIGSINERSVVTDNNGIELTVGTGNVLDSFRYLSTTTGSTHQFGVVKSNVGLYHYDVILRKFYRFSGEGTAPLSDIHGLSSFFGSTINNEIVTEDITLRATDPVGIHGVYDHRHNRMLFTFLKVNEPIPGQAAENFTIGYNEALDAFESFYSFIPGIYLNTGRRLLSVDSANQNNVYLHDEGVKCSFYGANPEESSITLLVAPDSDAVKIFNNLEYNSEISLNGVDIPAETLSALQIDNDYQTSANIPLIVNANIKRRMRLWRYTIGRDQNSANQNARFRDYSIFLKLIYDNNNNKRLVLHDIIITYTPSRN
jgi:hypothetical protein